MARVLVVPPSRNVKKVCRFIFNTNGPYKWEHSGARSLLVHIFDTSRQMVCMIYSGQINQFPDILHNLAHVAAWDPYNLHDLAPLSRVGPVLCNPYTTSHNSR